MGREDGSFPTAHTQGEGATPGFPVAFLLSGPRLPGETGAT